MINDTYKLLASVTVVRELYDADCSIYDVLEKFINEIIVRHRLFTFYASELTEQLNKEYSFKLNEAIVKTCLKRMGIRRENRKYKCVDLENRRSNSEVNAFFDESSVKNEQLFLSLYKYISERLAKELSDKEIAVVKNSFCDFLLEDNTKESGGYTRYFHEFILSLEKDASMMKTLKEVKEGILLYEGIRYSSDLGQVGSWNSNMNLVLDTEILFAIGGYNSSMYQEMYTELDSYLNEINRGCPSNAPKIKLSYFPETKNEIDAYFESAERIVRGQDYLDPTKEAMGQIVNNCKYASDVQTKRTLFYQRLKDKNIFVLNRDFYDETIKDNIDYNLEEESIIDKYTTVWGEKRDRVFQSLRCLSHINVLRKGKNNSGFENCGFIFLTATGRTIKLASTDELLSEGNVPLATTFDFLINRFWFKLNKGFGSNRTPRTMDMVMRARHILSSIVNNKAADIFDDLKKQYENDEITKEQFFALNQELRSKLKKPDEIEVDTISSDIDDLERWDMGEIIEQQKKKDIELNNAKETISALKQQLNQNKESYDKVNAELEMVQFSLAKEKEKKEEETKRLGDELQEEKNKNLENTKDIVELKTLLDEERSIRLAREKRNKLIKYRITCLFIGLIAIAGIVLFVYGYIKDYTWAKAISGLLESSVIITVISSVVKKLKPKE